MDEPSAALEALAAAQQRDRLAVAAEALDHCHLLELGAHWGTTADVAFGRLEGQSVGVVAPAHVASRDASHKVRGRSLGGGAHSAARPSVACGSALCASSSCWALALGRDQGALLPGCCNMQPWQSACSMDDPRKVLHMRPACLCRQPYEAVLSVWLPSQVARFVRFCDAFEIPLVVLLDPAGQKTAQAPRPDLRGVAQLLFAFAEASVPKLALLLSPLQPGSLLSPQVPSPAQPSPAQLSSYWHRCPGWRCCRRRCSPAAC